MNDKQTARPEDLAKYTYSELCFVFDNLRGYTSQLAFGDNNLVSLGLNGLLEQHHPKIKEYLLSTDKNKYNIGLFTLFAGLADGGHTVLITSEDRFSDVVKEAMNTKEFKPLITNLLRNAVYGQYDETCFKNKKIEVFNMTDKSVDDDLNYYHFDATTKTAYVGFDHFRTDFRAWDDYYKGEGDIPVDTDTYAFVRDKFYQAKKDGVENLVIDLTSNGGGSSSAVMGIMGLLNKAKAVFDLNDTFNKYRISQHTSLDVNLDGKYDEDDAKELEQFTFNIGILTSKCSFSSGNLLPSILKELGYKILGERSGGGSCAIIREGTADGSPYVHSSYHCLSDANGNNIDSGVPVDFATERIEGDDPTQFDASNFFDIAKVAEYLSTAYKTQE